MTMVQDDELILAGLLCARLCHDLAGPLGAVATGAELLGEDSSDESLMEDALELLRASAVTAGSRLRYLRLALGGVGGEMAAANLKAAIEEFLAPGPGAEAPILEWQDDEARIWDPVSARLLLNIVLFARDC